MGEIRKIYTDRTYFIWGEMLCRAVGTVQAGRTELIGTKAEVLILSPSCTRREALRICHSFGADMTFLDLNADQPELITEQRDVLIPRSYLPRPAAASTGGAPFMPGARKNGTFF
jgi:hypothetical protein